ncbi:MAG: hypothetical protein Q8Q12_10665 [bacterium]|nr:hypothetical protein [bacterium]
MFDVAKELCDALISHQIRDESSADWGGILCPAHGEAHSRSAEALFPFCYFYSETKEARYLDSALALLRWLSRRQKDDGSWDREEGEIPELGTVSLILALSHAYQLVERELTPRDRAIFLQTLRRAAEYVYSTATPESGRLSGADTNCLALAAPALHFAYSLTAEEKYRDRARDTALWVTQRINEDGFLLGEPPRGSGGLPLVDIGFDLEIGLSALAVYSCLSGNEEVRDAVLESLRAHLSFITPSGYIDDSWGTRVYEWTILGTAEGHGCQVGCLALRNFDPRFQRAAGQNLRFMVKNMLRDGLVTTGPHAKDFPEYFPCVTASALRANAICQTLIYSSGVPLAQVGKWILPTEEKGWVKFYKSVNVLQVRTSALLCTITGYGAGKPQALFPTGGTISHLWNERFGTVQAATSCRVRADDRGEQLLGRCLTPRIEAAIGGRLFCNLFERDAVLQFSEEDLVNDRLDVTARGRLKSSEGEDAGLTYAIAYRFDRAKIVKQIEIGGTAEAAVRIVEPIVFSKGCDVLRLEKGIEVKHPAGSSCSLTAAPHSARIRQVSREDAIRPKSPPALFALPVIIEPLESRTPCRMSYMVELHEWE